MAVALCEDVTVCVRSQLFWLQVCQAMHEPAVAVHQLLDMLAAGISAGPGGVAGLFKLLDGEGVRTTCPLCMRLLKADYSAVLPLQQSGISNADRNMMTQHAADGRLLSLPPGARAQIFVDKPLVSKSLQYYRREVDTST